MIDYNLVREYIREIINNTSNYTEFECAFVISQRLNFDRIDEITDDTIDKVAKILEHKETIFDEDLVWQMEDINDKLDY